MGNFFTDLGRGLADVLDPSNALGLGSSKNPGWLTGSSAQGSGSVSGSPGTNNSPRTNNYGPAPSGTGLGFLTGINYGSAGLTQEQMAADPFGGSWKQNYTPAFLAQFLKGEMGPGGYLGAASQTRATALGMGQIVRGGEADIAAQQRSMAAAGVASPSLAAMRSANQSVMADRARSYLTQRRAEQDEMRFDAMKGFIDMMSQTVAAQKALEANYAAAERGAKATERAGKSQAIGSGIGGLLGAVGAIGAAVASI